MPSEDRPDGPLTGLLHEYGRRLNAAERHTAAEGHVTDSRVVLDSYDRVLHPWLHGRRLPDLLDRYGHPIEHVGFVVGLALGVLRYGPPRLADRLRGRVW